MPEVRQRRQRCKALGAQRGSSLGNNDYSDAPTTVKIGTQKNDTILQLPNALSNPFKILNSFLISTTENTQSSGVCNSSAALNQHKCFC